MRGFFFRLVDVLFTINSVEFYLPRIAFVFSLSLYISILQEDYIMDLIDHLEVSYGE